MSDIVGLEAGLTILAVSTVLGLIWAFINYKQVTNINIRDGVESLSDDAKESINKL